jgi:hypothetical protein
VSIDLYSNVLIKFITNSYDFKYKKYKNIKSVEYKNIFLTSALLGGEWSASRPDRFTPGERALDTYWIGGWVSPRAGVEDVEKTVDPTGTETPTPRLSSP